MANSLNPLVPDEAATEKSDEVVTEEDEVDEDVELVEDEVDLEVDSAATTRADPTTTVVPTLTPRTSRPSPPLVLKALTTRTHTQNMEESGKGPVGVRWEWKVGLRLGLVSFLYSAKLQSRSFLVFAF
jgi:hypothetical protein